MEITALTDTPVIRAGLRDLLVDVVGAGGLCISWRRCPLRTPTPFGRARSNPPATASG
jgi:hypothetical protein